MDLPSLVATVLGALKAMTIERGCTAAEAAAAKSKALQTGKNFEIISLNARFARSLKNNVVGWRGSSF
jgi:hypothetical protein